MNTTIETLLAHRSIRKFTDAKIDEQVIDKIIQAGQAASTSSYFQPTTVIRITDSAKRKRLARFAGDQAYIEAAPEFFVFCADWRRTQTIVAQRKGLSEDDTSAYGWVEQLLIGSIDTALFAQNCAIAAESLGLGICYIGGLRNEMEAVADCLALPDLVAPLFGLCVGYPDQTPILRPRLPRSSVMYENTYPRTTRELNQDLPDYDAQVTKYYEERTRGKLVQSFSEQLVKQTAQQTRPHVRAFLQSKKLALK